MLKQSVHNSRTCCWQNYTQHSSDNNNKYQQNFYINKKNQRDNTQLDLYLYISFLVYCFTSLFLVKGIK